MTTNVGSADRAVRLALAVLAAVVAFVVGVGSTLGIMLLVVASVMAITGVVRFCPLYRLFGMNTCPVDQRRVGA